MGLAGLPTCRSVVGEKERLLEVSRSPLTVLKPHFISSEEQLTPGAPDAARVREATAEEEEKKKRSPGSARA